MIIAELRERLDRIATSRDIGSELETLAEELSATRPTLKSVEVILGFMEDHPHLDLGLPGPLTHYVEKLYRRGYEAKLLESIQRRPTDLTVWMLNRVINGTNDPGVRRRLVAAMRAAGRHPKADAGTQAEVKQFLDYQDGGNT